MSLWSDCIAERQGHRVIEEPFGFIEFHIVDKICIVDDLYVVPTERRKGLAWGLADRVSVIAKAAGCTHLWSGIYADSLTANDALRANLAYGFEWKGIDGGRIILLKELK